MGNSCFYYSIILRKNQYLPKRFWGNVQNFEDKKCGTSRCFKNFFLIVLHLNWQAIHKIALNLVSQVQYKRISKKRLMFRVAIEPTLFLDILFDSFFRFPSKVNAVVV